MNGPLIKACIFLLCALAMSGAGCGPAPLGTQTIEESFLGEGHANQLYDYGLQLYDQGRLREAHAAFMESEGAAYTTILRQKARTYRIYLEKVIAAHEKGMTPPSPPVTLKDTPLAQRTGPDQATIKKDNSPQSIGVEKR